MRHRVFRLIVSLLAAPLFLADSGPCADGSLTSADRAVVVASCPDGTHWDPNTGTCR